MKMAACRWCGFALTVLWLVIGVSFASLGFLNLEELTEMKYGIEILSEPVIKGQSKADNIVTISSKYKQNYECKLPAVAVKFHQEREEEQQEYSGLGISDLLRPMEAAPCLIKTKDWWTYEFCYGKHIQQYRVEDSEVKGDILSLGTYQSEFDWNNETAKASKHHRLKRYHSQMYVNGSKCDLNGKSRETEVRFMCEEGFGDYIARVDEPQSCTYVLTVHTTRICHHPFLRPSSNGSPQSIKCHPALSPEQYVEYVKAQVSDTKRIVEELSEELKTLDLKARAPKTSGSSDPFSSKSKTERSKPAESDQQKQESEPESSLESQNLEEEHRQDLDDTDFWNRVLRPQDREAQTAETDNTEDFSLPNNPAGQPEGHEKNVRYKMIRNPDDLVKFIAELKKSEKKQTQEDGNDLHSSPSEEDTSPTSDRNSDDEEDERALMQEFENELVDILLPKTDLSQVKEDVKTEMVKEFDNIINEAQEELETEGLKGEFDRKEASKSLATTLNKLIDKLDDTDTEKGEDTSMEDEKSSEIQSNPEPIAKSPSDEQLDDRIKVRVTKIQRGSSEQDGRKVSEMSSDNPQLKQIQNVVKDLLEKEGLKAEGKIEIKILTTGGFGDEGDGHWLSEENLKDIFFNLLIQGTEEAHKEQKRQQQLEDNYRFVWNENQDDLKSKSANSDSDDVDF
ncbi:protein OS-9 [Bombina bombina]|uniref:protein OS-9 n=1 Tax=Bombina bombina TaxID=8345 RepID=UPI00235B08BB|nr:protein OS-9 [Bombina bombina]